MAESGGSLSQDEIDALLGMSDGGAAPAAGGAASGGGDLNLESLLGDLGGGSSEPSMGLDADALSALAGAVGGPSLSSGGGGGGGGGRSSGRSGGGERSQSADNVELLLDVTLRFTVELGRTQMFIKDVLLLGEGSIVELDKNVGDEVDILVNDRFFGRGRLVVMDDFFGVQITYIADALLQYRKL